MMTSGAIDWTIMATLIAEFQPNQYRIGGDHGKEIKE
jgi:hypothetical protein